MDLNGSFTATDISITNATASVSEVSSGIYEITVTPDDNATDTNINLSINGSTISTQYFGNSFQDADINLSYTPQAPVINSDDYSHWIRGHYSEFTVIAQNHRDINISGLPQWMEFNNTTGILSGIPDDGNSSTIVISAHNPAVTTAQTHQLNVFDPSLFGAKLELSPSGVLSEQAPYNIEGLVLKLDGTKIPDQNGSVINSWADSSGNDRHLDQHRGTPKVRISEELDKQKVVHFDGYSQLYSGINFGTLLDDYSIVSLVRHTGGNDKAVISSVGTDWVFGLGENKSAYWKMGANLLNSGTSSDDQWHMLSGMVRSDGSVELLARWIFGRSSKPVQLNRLQTKTPRAGRCGSKRFIFQLGDCGDTAL